VLHDDAAAFDARTILETAVREQVQMMSIVGDAYARPIVDELRHRRYDLTSLTTLATGGAMTSPVLKHALLELLPHLMIIDGYGASETGAMAFGASRTDAETQQFRGSSGAAVLSEDRSHFLEPGTDEIGWMARLGRIPLGYLNDPQATERTFPVVDGRRLAVPGDRATVSADGSIVLLGRDSMVINSGGEKIFVEEVEEVIRLHPEVEDAVVVGRPSVRFGEEVVAIVQLRPGSDLAPEDVRVFAAGAISRFKAPRAVLLCELVARHPSGKADYRWAREAALDAVAVAD
jgi:fatty-acyl-CoA synthase